MVSQSMAQQSQSRLVLNLTLLLSQVLAIAGAAPRPIPPLSTSSRWVVDRFGVRVKLACVNWVGHLLSLREVHRRVVSILTAHGLMVILGNHVSKPQWCCSSNDGNGFWGDAYFNADEWLQGLTTVASTFSSNPFVVAMTLRNELRGPRQNEADWRVLMSQAAEAVHDVNPNVLIVAGGLSSATDLNFLGNNKALDTEHFPGKLVYEFHWYKWNRLAKGSNFNNASEPDACSNTQNNVHIDNGFLVDQGTPLLLAEFGINLGSVSYAENRFLDCVMDYLRRVDLDWAFWALQGSYYLRNGKEDVDEEFGLLGSTWRTWRNPRVIARLQYGIQNSTQGSSRRQ